MGDGQTERQFQPADRAGESITFNGADPDAQYRFVIETYINASAEYEFEGAVESRQGIETPDVDFGANTDVDPFADIDYDPDGDDSVDPSTPKTVGWYNEAERYTGEQRPRDPNGHGSHCAGIVSGTGEASVIDYQNTTKEEPQAIILPTEFIEYEADVRSTSTVFVSALGDKRSSRPSTTVRSSIRPASGPTASSPTSRQSTTPEPRRTPSGFVAVSGFQRRPLRGPP